jgi:hypothetical protein
MYWGSSNLTYDCVLPFRGVVGYMFGRRIYLFAVLLLAPLGASAQARVDTVVLQSGDGLAGRWIGEERDVVRDFTDLFGRRPSAVTGVAIMADTDNTRTATVAWFDDVQASISRLPDDRH